ncbi:MAG: chorismate-binding protein, partial [Rhodospirillaceae bacterium]|nr:chorismate-binding protein [Rhodospirillaceae bacterium]
MTPTPRILVEPIAYRDPAAAFAPFAHMPFAMLLDGGSQGAQAQFAYIAVEPFKVITRKPTETTPDPFAELRAALNAFHITPDAGLPAPFIGGAVGFVGYEVGSALEHLPPRKPPSFPLDLAFGLYDVVVAFDLKNKKAWVMSSGLPERDGQARTARAKARAAEITARLGETLPTAPQTPQATWTADFSEPAYKQKIAAIIELIRAGEIYQANMTQRWTAPWPKDLTAFGLYQRLRAISAAPFAAYLSVGDNLQIISASPERFLNVDTKGQVETRPIKGTRPRGKTPEEDRALAAELRASAKDR